jgi:hypothetical protein
MYSAVQYYNAPGAGGPAIASLDNPAYAKQDAEIGQLSKASEKLSQRRQESRPGCFKR